MASLRRQALPDASNLSQLFALREEGSNMIRQQLLHPASGVLSNSFVATQTRPGRQDAS